MESIKRNRTIGKIADCIVSPLALGSDENYTKVLQGQSVAKLHENAFGLPEPFFGSLFDRVWIDDTFDKICRNPKNVRYTRFEKIAIVSAQLAVNEADIDATKDDVIFVLSTTKGNVDLLQDPDGYGPERAYLWSSAELIADYFGNPNKPLVVSNACISGVAAQLTAFGFLNSGRFRHAVVIGAEMLSRFVISGFQSFKALSAQRCKPFDKDRTGLNLGEGAATLVFSASDENIFPANAIIYRGGGNRNDANHISGPSRTGEGLHNAIEKALSGIDRGKLAFINAHGTATPYNDDMESFGIARSGLENTPVNSLKGYFGHTLGAAGILETIISSKALQSHTVLPTCGHENFGVVNRINICTETQSSENEMFMKLISGFGGSNAAIVFGLNKTS